MKILIAQGVNLDLLGRREPHHYGTMTLAQLHQYILDNCPAGLQLDFFQTNREDAFLEKLTSSDADGIILNPGAWTHTSLALADRLACVTVPMIEVHLSPIESREPIRQINFVSPFCRKTISGLGSNGYISALSALAKIISDSGAAE